MKKWILVMAMLVGFGVNAQQRDKKDNNRPQREKREMLSPEQRTELRVKKMTLALDLTDAQQSEVKKLMAERSKKREAAIAKFKSDKEAGKKPTQDERFAMKSKMLDEQIAMKREMKEILTPEQFEKYSKMKQMRQRKITKHAEKRHFPNRK